MLQSNEGHPTQVALPISLYGEDTTTPHKAGSRAKLDPTILRKTSDEEPLGQQWKRFSSLLFGI